MKRRTFIAFIWFWGLWSTGSTLDYLGAVPTWPFVLLGIALAAFLLFPRHALEPQRSATPERIEAQ